MSNQLVIPKRYRRTFSLMELLRYRKINKAQIAAEAKMNAGGVDFRVTGEDENRNQYSKMSQEDFEAINARQQWANWILIGKCLHKRVPDKPLNVLDFGCGTGTSTAVLAGYLPNGSQIIGTDIAENLLEVARGKNYKSLSSGTSVSVDFQVQTAGAPLVGKDGETLKDGTIDYINTSGVVGHHFNREHFAGFIKDVSPLVKADSFAAIDEGPGLGEEEIIPEMEKQGWSYVGPIRLLPWIKAGQLMFRRA